MEDVIDKIKSDASNITEDNMRALVGYYVLKVTANDNTLSIDFGCNESPRYRISKKNTASNQDLVKNCISNDTNSRTFDNGSPSRIWTYDLVINSHLLHRWAIGEYIPRKRK